MIVDRSCSISSPLLEVYLCIKLFNALERDKSMGGTDTEICSISETKVVFVPYIITTITTAIHTGLRQDETEESKDL